jgi:hypothetical protein
VLVCVPCCLHMAHSWWVDRCVGLGLQKCVLADGGDVNPHWGVLYPVLYVRVWEWIVAAQIGYLY